MRKAAEFRTGPAKAEVYPDMIILAGVTAVLVG